MEVKSNPKSEKSPFIVIFGGIKDKEAFLKDILLEEYKTARNVIARELYKKFTKSDAQLSYTMFATEFACFCKICAYYGVTPNYPNYDVEQIGEFLNIKTKLLN